MDDGLISIIVPVYMTEAYIEACLNSILAQTYKKLEIILVDDGSADRCPVLCDAYARQDSRIQVVHQANRGVAAARNAGLERAAGRYIGFADSDDWMHPNIVETLYGLLRRTGADIAMCNFFRVQNDVVAANELSEELRGESVLTARQAYPYMLAPRGLGCFIWNKLYDRALFEGGEPVRFAADIAVCEDRLLNMQIMRRAERIAYTDDALYYYRIREDSASRAKGRDARNELEARKRLLELIPEEAASYDKSVYLDQLVRLMRGASMWSEAGLADPLHEECKNALKAYGRDFFTHKKHYTRGSRALIAAARVNYRAMRLLWRFLRKPWK